MELKRSHVRYWIEVEINSVPIYPMSIDSFYIKKSFFEYRLPVYVLTLNLTYKDIEQIFKNGKGGSIYDPYVDINKLVVYYSNIDVEDDSEPIKDVYMELTSCVGLIDQTSNEYEEYMDDEIIDPGTNQPLGGQRQMIFGIYNHNDIKAFQKDYVNNVFHNFKLDTLIAHVFDITSNPKLSFVLSPSDNKDEFEVELCPPRGCYQMIEYIDQEFGIYYTDYYIFIDNNVVYMLNKNPDHQIDLSDPGFLDIGKELDEVHIWFLEKDTGFKQTMLEFKEGQHHIYVSRETNVTEMVPAVNYMGDIEVRADWEGGECERNDQEDKHTLVTVSNIRRRIPRKYYNYARFKIDIESAPIKFAPYTYVNIYSKDSSGKYRVEGYEMTITGDGSASTEVTIFLPKE